MAGRNRQNSPLQRPTSSFDQASTASDTLVRLELGDFLHESVEPGNANCRAGGIHITRYIMNLHDSNLILLASNVYQGHPYSSKYSSKKVHGICINMQWGVHILCVPTPHDVLQNHPVIGDQHPLPYLGSSSRVTHPGSEAIGRQYRLRHQFHYVLVRLFNEHWKQR